MNIANFDDLLRAARAQDQPQRLLFVFATAEVPDDATPAQRARHAAGEGGTLTPLMCVDKTPDELTSFEALLEESREMSRQLGADPDLNPDFNPDVVFVAALAGAAGIGPGSAQAEAPLQCMVDAVKSGGIGAFIPFDGRGQVLRFE